MERHAITVLVMVMVALILWVGSNVQQAQVQLAAIEVELGYIKRQTTNDGEKFREIERRLDGIERQLEAHMQPASDH
jgi:hypothetical protein